MQKKELHPGVMWGALGLVALIIAGLFLMSARESSEIVDPATVDLIDKDPPRPGQEGYRQRTTDQPVGRP